MIFDFSFILAAATLLTGLIWALDAGLEAQTRAAAVAGGVPAETSASRCVVEYARSFFPVILIVLLIRSFLFEPFRIPSDSMMPTLLDGDFIFVNKFAYGLRLPVVNYKVVAIGEPAARRRDRVPSAERPRDQLHQAAGRAARRPHRGARPAGVRQRRAHDGGAWTASTRATAMTVPQSGAPSIGSEGREASACCTFPGATAGDYDEVVPAGHYFFMGDNRDNSRDSRFPEVGLRAGAEPGRQGGAHLAELGPAGRADLEPDRRCRSGDRGELI